jgi:hypothetical protein
MLLKCVRVAAVLSATLLLLGLLSGMVFAADAAAPTAPAVAATPPPVQVHGYLQNRIYVPSGGSAEYRVERISLSALATLPKDSNAYVEWYYHPWTGTNGLYAESAYYDTALTQGRLRVGKGRRMTFGVVPAYPNRKTTNYGLVAEAMTQERIQGIQYTVQKGTLDAGLSLHTAYRLGIRNIGDVPGDDVRNTATPTHVGHVVPHLAFRDPVSGGGTPTTTPNQLSRNLQISGRLGGKWGNGLKAGISYSYAGLDRRDITNLTTAAAANVLSPLNPLTGLTPVNPLGVGFTKENMHVLGLDATYKHPCGLVLQGEFFDASVSNLDYNAWNALVGYEMPSGWKLFARYGAQNMDTLRTDNPLSWDTQQLSLSLVEPLRKGLWLQYEYEHNMENSNTGVDVPNDIFFVELFSGF